MEKNLSGKIKFVAGVVEKFVENNLIEKEQRDQNFRKLALAFETLVKENPLRSNLAKSFGPGEAAPVRVLIKKLENFKGDLPRYQSRGASGLDVRAQLTEPLVIEPGSRALIPTGMAMACPEGYEIQARPRSGWAIRDGMTLLNTPGTIDSDYRGEVKIIVINLGEKAITVKDQDRIAQLCLCPILQADLVEVEDLASTSRGEGGFGSTGV